MTSFFPSAFPAGGFYDTFFDPFTDMEMDFDIVPELAPDYSGRMLTGAGAGGRRAEGAQPGAGNRRQRRAADRQQWQNRARVNLAQEEDKYCVCVEVPGRTKEDLCVSLEGNILKVCAKPLLPEEEEQEETRQQPQRQQQPPQPVPIQGEGQPAGSAQQAESKEAELSGGEKMREREGRVEESSSRPQERKQQRRFLIPGRIERSVRLPADAAEEGICAKCEHGLLQVCVPRLPKKRPVEIK